MLARCKLEEQSTYIFREAGFKTTSLGITAKGVLAADGGVFGNGGGTDAVVELAGVAAVVAASPGSIPAARKRPRRDAGSGTGVAAGVTEAGGWYG